MTRLVVAAAAALAIGLPALPGVASQHDDQQAARRLLERAASVAGTLTFEGTLVTVTFDGAGPSVSEMRTTHGRDGQVHSSRGDSWMVGRSGDDAFLWEPDAGRLLRFVGMDPVPFSIERLLSNYDLRLAGTRQLETGRAAVIAARQHGTQRDREHLYADRQTGLIVRRDTFQDDGAPARVIAFTELRTTSEPAPAPPTPDAAAAMPAQVLDEQQLRVLESVGWVAPRTLPGGYRLWSGHALPDPETGTLNLVYSDGLYTLSLYEQHGRLRADALEGAVALRRGGVRVHRWPGAQPARLVWSGDGLIFTVVTDAPYDHALSVVAALPQDPPSPLLRSLLKRIERAAGRLWPFG